MELRLSQAQAHLRIKAFQMSGDRASLRLVERSLQVAQHEDGVIDMVRALLDVSPLQCRAGAPEIFNRLFVQQDDETDGLGARRSSFAIAQSGIHCLEARGKSWTGGGAVAAGAHVHGGQRFGDLL